MYAIETAKQEIHTLLAPYFGSETLKIDTVPPHVAGDFAVPVFALAKVRKTNPAQIAKELSQNLILTNTLFDSVSPQGGFLNFNINYEIFAQKVLEDFERKGASYGVPDNVTHHPITVLDYSSPNVAKEMHVGHLRSTVIGDALNRILTFMGHKVIPQNHLGDWGTQFGMLIEYCLDNNLSLTEGASISDLNSLYQAAKKKDDEDSDFAERARKRVVLLQQGDSQTRAIWQALIRESMRHFNEVYRRLGVLLQDSDLKPESAYNDALEKTVSDLKSLGLTTVDNGAVCIFVPGFEREGKPTPMIIQKSDGGFLYHTTDLAAMRYRVNTLKANNIIYVVDVRQSDHFKMLFAVAEKAHWLPEGEAVHVAFGTILGPDNKPFKTREGGTIRLMDLLEEAVSRAKTLIDSKKSDFSDAEKQQLAEMVGVSAVKYADLSSDRRNDYVFDWDKLLAFEGNTAPYLQYANVRIQAILQKAGDKPVTTLSGLNESAEKALIKQLALWPETVQKTAERLEPHHIATTLFTLAQCFTQFYDAAPILKADDDQVREMRLTLCVLTQRVLQSGLQLLGIAYPKRM